MTSNALVPGFVLTPLNARLQQDTAAVEALADFLAAFARRNGCGARRVGAPPVAALEP